MSENSTINEHLNDDEEEDSQRHSKTELTPLNNEKAPEAPRGTGSTANPNKANLISVRSYLSGSQSNASTKPGKLSSPPPS